jgi:hypothetical protein
MNNLGHKDEWLIQWMVDGELSGKEVMKFRQLIINSQHARKLYGELLYVHTALQSEAHFIGSVDFSDEIMQRLYG